ncbi:hypothetical protein N6L27_09975 [Leisingera sp. SS27]|nr:hypothetical protein [Leisingera sp. SS27]
MIRRKELPDLENLRTEITVGASNIAMWAVREDGRGKVGQKFPRKPAVEELLAEITSEITTLQPIPKGKRMTVEQLAEQATVYRLVASYDEDPEDVISLFKDKTAARALWQRAEGVRRQIKSYEAAVDAYHQAISDWEVAGRIARYHDDGDLVGLLQEMEPYDRDLWHVITVENEIGHRVHQDALYWIFSQPTCDGASVAAFIQRHAGLGYMASLVASEWKRGETQFADQVAAIIRRWNQGFYTSTEFEFSDGDLEFVVRRFHEQRAEAQEILGREPWGIPDGLFRDFPGRTPQPTLYFRNSFGLMKLPPQPEQFFT